MTGDSSFQRYLPESFPDQLVADDKVRRLIICSGQVYQQLLKEREDRKCDDIAIARLEQISPFPYDLVLKDMDRYPNADIMWAQEEVSSPLTSLGSAADDSFTAIEQRSLDLCLPPIADHLETL